MAMQSSYKQSFYTSATVGVRRKIKRSGSVELPGGILLWRAAVKPLMILVCCTFMVNLAFMFVINMQGYRVHDMKALLNQVTEESNQLEIENNRVNSLEYIEREAWGKLNLVKAGNGQIVYVN